ncbi:MAG: HxlR-like helix-turn-helix [Solirubrobacterales bacterium]|jgi:DNA-binding HxlR family transcriptional regulator|nr:HxlR-like helix-turn-helix [Solirubrobacterales bacterium]
MSTGLPDTEVEPAEREDACVAGASTADVLRLLSAGATGAILMALGEGPLRTMELTERVPGYSPRTIYRYAGRLAELEVVSREEEPGVPSKVVHALTDECGAELYQLVNRFADASLTRLPDGRIDATAWASLGLLADLWETGMVEHLACEGRSATQLAQGGHGLSYHQVQRRAGMFKTGGLLSLLPGEGNRRCYELTEKTRRKMGLLAGVARWRNRHVVAEDEEGMTATEMATVLRTALPLATLPGQVGKCLQFSIRSEDEAGAEGEEVWANVEPGGGVHSCANPPADSDGWVRGTVEAWISVLLDGDSSAVLGGGEESLVSECLDSLYETLWTPGPF